MGEFCGKFKILGPHFLETASQPVGLFLGGHYIKLGLDWKRLAWSASEPLQVGSAQIFFGIVLERKNFAFSLSRTRKLTFSHDLEVYQPPAGKRGMDKKEPLISVSLQRKTNVMFWQLSV